uniref:C2H2-type domain-containing protein n=1 Tax=Varanus komodoensis TaxID=61221 RepID=A0A8D2KUJ5_VARKO
MLNHGLSCCLNPSFLHIPCVLGEFDCCKPPRELQLWGSVKMMMTTTTTIHSIQEHFSPFPPSSVLVIQEWNKRMDNPDSASELPSPLSPTIVPMGKKSSQRLARGAGFAPQADLVRQGGAEMAGRTYACLECGAQFELLLHLTFSSWYTLLPACPSVHFPWRSLFLLIPLAASPCFHSGALLRLPVLTQIYKCTKCGKMWSFSQVAHLTLHKRIYTGENPYRCMECRKSFNTRGKFNLHQTVHTGEKPYKCMECGKHFKRHTQLCVHQRNHMGEKPYKCMHCGRSFSGCVSLKIHLRSHTGEKPYQCMEFGKNFKNSAREKPYKCTSASN